jgi:hypothetical protein
MVSTTCSPAAPISDAGSSPRGSPDSGSAAPVIEVPGTASPGARIDVDVCATGPIFESHVTVPDRAVVVTVHERTTVTRTARPADRFCAGAVRGVAAASAMTRRPQRASRPLPDFAGLGDEAGAAAVLG